jgi:hypothetical protein
MAFKFSSLLSSEDILKLQIVSSEMKRIFELPDRFLGREILRLARQARLEDPERLGKATCNFYENTAVWSVLPGIAKKLGETGFTADEKAEMLYIPEKNDEFREYVGAFLTNSQFKNTAGLNTIASKLLSHDVANGNPVAMAMDRISPPVPDSNDNVVRLVREVSRSRFGDERFSSWSPEMQKYKDADVSDPFDQSDRNLQEEVIEP